MRLSLLERLAEPRTGSPLRLENAEVSNGRAISGNLISESGTAYPIVRGIPRFVPSTNYAEQSFGRQWNKFRDVQLDSARGRTLSTTRFDDETGWSVADVRGKWVLDAGCGAGRFAEVVASRDANVVALDLSSAVDATAETLSRFPNVDVVQGSLLEPPFRHAVFDFAYSIGVIQHTPDPEKGIRAVVDTVEPGGRFAFTIYGRKPWTKLHAKYLIRPFTTRVPEAALLRGIEMVMPIAFPVTNFLYRVPLLGKLARFTVPIANYIEYDELTRQQRYAESVLDTFDMLAPKYDNPMTATEVQSVLDEAKVSSFEFRSCVPVVVNGVR